MNLEQVIDMILEYEDRLLRQYRENILNNFKKNSRSERNLSERQYFILYIIIYKQINTITEIANYLSLSKANISILTTKLEENGFIEREKGTTSDSRVSVIKVTEKGNKTFNEVRNNMIQSHKKMRENFESANIDIDEVISNLKRVTNIDQSTENIEDVVRIVSMKLSNIFEEIYHNIIKLYDFDLSVAEFKIIKKLGLLNGDEESLNVKEDNLSSKLHQRKANFEILTEEMSLSYSTLSLQVKGLVEKEFISKAKSFDDGRVTYLLLTDKGQNVYEIYKKQKFEAVKARLSHKTSSEISDFITVFDSLFKVMDIAHKKINKEDK